MSRPNIENELAGEPRQRIALRLAPLVTQLEVEDILCWLSEPVYADKPVYLLTAYEYQDGGSDRPATPQLCKALLREVQAVSGLRKKLKLLPSNHYVWSDELALAFTLYVDMFIGRDEAADSGMGLRWNAALGPYTGLIGECPNFSTDDPGKRLVRKMKTAARHAKWQGLVDKTARRLPSHSHRSVCGLVALELREAGEEVDLETIRRKTRLS